MKIAAVVITCNRLPLLSRALKSIAKQNRKPDFVFVVSNSTDENYEAEKIICNDFGFTLIKNLRTQTYTGGLNSSVEEIIKHFGINDEIYFASLDDDDEWLPDYLQEIENNNTENFDLLIGNLLRKSETENELLTLPAQLTEKDFFTGNPGVCGSNTFIRLTTLLQAGCFDEGLPATADRDFFVRVFQQKPKYKILNKHFVNQYTENDRPRETISGEKKKRSLQIFFYKYQHLMNETEKQKFFDRAKKFFNVSREEIESIKPSIAKTTKNEIQFNNKGNYQFVIGFIAGSEIITERIVKQIAERKIPVDLVVIIEDVPKGKSLAECEAILKSQNISYSIVRQHDWQANLASGHYGSYFKQFSAINSIPLGRTILHHHLFTQTTEMENPVYWIIDDDISFSATTSDKGSNKVNLFEIINQHFGNVDALIGSISNDPPVPTLCCIRGQLVDFIHSHNANNSLSADLLSIQSKPDYYYDLSDIHSDHTEMPIYHTAANSENLQQIFSGKSVSRQALQNELKAESKTVTKRGANTLVFNRELLHYYPVINLEVNNKFARRGDLLWALLNQIVSGKKILEHSFSLDHNRPKTDFILAKELDKVAYDIIGYAFNKGIMEVINEIKEQTNPHRPKDIFEKLNQENFYLQFLKTYNYFLERRKTRFLMNYYRIIGLTKLLSENFAEAKSFYSLVSEVKALNAFHSLLASAQEEETLKTFFSDLTTTIWTYSNSITDITEDDKEHQSAIEKYFGLKKHLRKLGSGAEGVAFTDENLVYKSYYNIPESDWEFLKEKSACFSQHSLLEVIECFETDENKFVRYPFHQFKPLQKVQPTEIISFLKFCKANEFVFTNINPKNCIQTLSSGQMKLIDYGKSFEPYTDEKLLNATKRAFMLWRFPKMDNNSFQKLTARINVGEEPDEIKGWEKFWFAVSPRSKEEILDCEVVSIFKSIQPKRLLDYGSGKCKTARQIRSETQVEIFVYDVDREVLENRCQDFPIYKPNDESFENSFDAALLNIVLCEVENSVTEEILSDISKALQQNGRLIVSVCNPDFAHIQKTEFQNRNFIPKNNAAEEVIIKTCIYTGKLKTEHHRPTGKYLELFSKFGFIVENIIDTKGVNLETIETASDFKIFMLRKV